MNNFLDTIVTVFENVTAQSGCDMPLRDFLDGRFQLELIEQIRATEDKKERQRLKSGLWCATISARCEGGRKETDPFQHTGLLCVDIDGQDNPAFPDAASMKSEICKVAEVLYCALSVSGRGCFAIFRLATPDNFEGHFKAINRLFKLRLGLNIDTQCGNIKRLRYASYDPEPYINPDAPDFRVADKVEASRCGKSSDDEPPAPRPTRSQSDSTTSPHQELSDEDMAERYVAELERSHIDITTSYDQWVKVGMALSNLGDSGRDLFHRVSRLNPNYKSGETDKKFSELMRTSRSVSIATFFHICHEHGVRVK